MQMKAIRFLPKKGGGIEGIAKLEGVVRIDGHFNWAIHTNDMLIIGEHAVIRGTITADEIICSGRIEANLTTQKSIQLLHPAVLIGDITTPAFSMEKGVFLWDVRYGDESNGRTVDERVAGHAGEG